MQLSIQNARIVNNFSRYISNCYLLIAVNCFLASKSITYVNFIIIGNCPVLSVCLCEYKSSIRIGHFLLRISHAVALHLFEFLHVRLPCMITPPTCVTLFACFGLLCLHCALKYWVTNTWNANSWLVNNCQAIKQSRGRGIYLKLPNLVSTLTGVTAGDNKIVKKSDTSKWKQLKYMWFYEECIVGHGGPFFLTYFLFLNTLT